MNLDRFAYGLKDQQNSKIYTYCEICDGEVYIPEEFLCDYCTAEVKRKIRLRRKQRDEGCDDQ